MAGNHDHGPIDQADVRELRMLEELLWRAGTRFDHSHMDSALAPGFIVFGRSGRAYSRAEVLDRAGYPPCPRPMRTLH
jgi:hypothetical protein